MITNKISDQPLQKIALSCSGGGYRAASFHLGSMSYLNRHIYNGKPLLENVKLISTVSGGTITGVVYALHKQKGKSFRDIYHFLLDQLHTLDLVKGGIEKLNPGALWNNTHKHKNLINAFAEQYDDAFTKGATIADLDGLNSHLEAVVFNSTEFNNAIDFRFKNMGTGYSGNYYIPVGQDIAAEIKLSDVMASSACFPGGFEPLLWPDDFVHEQAPHISELKKNSKAPVGIMDGGIYDNQGIESILNYKSKNEIPYFDLIIISDVASPYMEPYKPFVETKKKGFNTLTLKEVKKKAETISKGISMGLLVCIALFALLPAIWQYPNNIGTGLSLGIAGVLLLLLIAKMMAVGAIKKKIAQMLHALEKKIPSFYFKKLSKLKIEELSVHRAQPLIMDRLNSLVTLLMDVFLKVVRRLNYYKLYNNNNFKYRRISNLIKELTEMDFNANVLRRQQDQAAAGKTPDFSIFNGTYNEVVGTAIKGVAESASSFGTTLWFTDDDKLSDMLDQLIATGQFTMCYNLIEYLEKLIYDKDSGYDGLDQQKKDNLQKLYSDCKEDWKQFKDDPMFMVKELG